MKMKARIRRWERWAERDSGRHGGRESGRSIMEAESSYDLICCSGMCFYWIGTVGGKL